MDIFEIAQSEFERLWGLTVVSANERCAKARFVLCDFENDEMYKVCFDSNTAVFRAGRKRALLYAVYDYFARAYGVRYFWDGERIPDRKSPPVKMSFTDAPKLKYRGLRYFAHRGLYRFRAEMWNEADWKNEIDWILKKRLNMFMLRTGDDMMFTLAFGSHAVTGEGRDGFYDRTPVRNEKKSLALREAIVGYARERDLIMPVDCGAMTHWYSPTPDDYLTKYNPTFLSQSNGLYADRNLLVWDVREKKNLDAYFALTDAYAEKYGNDGIFHTIGLAERLYGASREDDLKLKKSLYKAILEHNAEKYPGSKTLIGSWDFAMSWSAQEVSDLTEELSDSGAILFDYVSDTTNDASNFEHWNVRNRFPYIFGIFHAYAPNDSIRGDYSLINSRIDSIMNDIACEGMVTWQELSHGDMPMLEFVSQNAWRPCHLPKEYYIGRYASDRFGNRYSADATAILTLVMPLAALAQYRHERENPERNIFRDFYLSLSPSRFGYSPDFSKINPTDVRRNAYFIPLYQAVSENIVPALRMICDLMENVAHDAMMARDLLDFARTVISRFLHFSIMIMQEEYYSCLERGNSSAKLREMTESIVGVTEQLTSLISTSDDFLLGATWSKLKRNGTDPSFLATLKRNCANDYCRSLCYETMECLSLPEERAVMKYVNAMPNAKSDEKRRSLAEEMNATVEAAREAFYADTGLPVPPKHKRRELIIDRIADMIESSPFLENS